LLDALSPIERNPCAEKTEEVDKTWMPDVPWNRPPLGLDFVFVNKILTISQMEANFSNLFWTGVIFFISYLMIASQHKLTEERERWQQ
jgi:hypothetical protein